MVIPLVASIVASCSAAAVAADHGRASTARSAQTSRSSGAASTGRGPKTTVDELDRIGIERERGGAPWRSLEVRDVTVRFGGNVALDGVSLEAEPGCVTGLIGPNGAGKTTLFNVITGLLPPNRGRVLLDGKDVTRLSPTKRARRGLARTFQRLELFSLLTSARTSGSPPTSARAGRATRTTRPRSSRRSSSGSASPPSPTRASTASPPVSAGSSSSAARSRRKPKVLLLDEPASGQDENETEQFAALLRELAAEGIVVVLVEHDVQLVMRSATTVHVLDFGQIIAVGTAGRDPDRRGRARRLPGQWGDARS